MAAKFRSGYATMVDYTPSGAAVSAGQFVALGSGKTYGIAHVDIVDGQAGAISIPNGSVIYEIDKAPRRTCTRSATSSRSTCRLTRPCRPRTPLAT